jgi:hypothetical protein
VTGRHGQSDLAGVSLSRGALLRAAADGELSDAQRAELERTLTEAESGAIETEAALRQAVGRAMAGPSAPQGLRDRIVVAAESGGAELAVHADDPDEIPAPIPMAPWMRPLAVAAALLLVIAGGFMFMRDEGGAGGGPGAGGDGAGGQQAGIQLVELRQFISREHTRCQRDPSRAARKFARAELSEIPERFRPLMGADVSIEEIVKAGLTLRGVGECHVPGPGSSIHLLLGADLPQCAATLSLFVQQDPRNRLELEEGVSYELTPQDPGAGATGVSVVAWRRDGLTYYLVADPDACSRIREAMGRGGRPSKL